jgi:hypothetical protein
MQLAKTLVLRGLWAVRREEERERRGRRAYISWIELRVEWCRGVVTGEVLDVVRLS